MVERRPLLGLLAHVVLVLGVLIVAFPVYITFVASTHANEAIVHRADAAAAGLAHGRELHRGADRHAAKAAARRRRSGR